MPLVSKPIRVNFGMKIPVTRILWLSQFQHSIAVVTSTTVYKTTLTLTDQQHLQLSAMEEEFKGRYGTPGICLCSSGDFFYGTSAPGVCGITVQLKNKDCKKRSINAQSAPASSLSASNTDHRYETRAVDSCSTFSLLLDDCGDNDRSNGAAACIVNIFAVAAEKETSLSSTGTATGATERSMSTSRSAPSRISLPSHTPPSRGLISVVSSSVVEHDHYRESVRDVATTYGNDGDTSRETSDVSSTHQSGAFPHVLPGVSLREALAVPAPNCSNKDTEGESRSILDDLQSIGLNLSASVEGINHAGLNDFGIAANTPVAPGPSITSPQSILSIGLIVETESPSHQGCPTVVLMSPSFPLTFMRTRSDSDDTTATELPRPDVLASHITSVSTPHKRNERNGKESNVVVINMLTAVGSSASSHILLIKTMCIFDQHWLVNHALSGGGAVTANGSVKWSLDVIEHYSLADQVSAL
jgi:hypothetical protein